MLNISIDPVDRPSAQHREDLSINDIESIVELVLEEVLNYENSCEETDDQDSDKTSSQSTGVAFTFFIQESTIERYSPAIPIEKKSFRISGSSSVLGPYTSITTPPPKFRS